MFPRPARRMTAGEWFELREGLVMLGLCMSNPEKYCRQPAGPSPPDSDIPSGYTYLGQFITHEITFDNTQDLPPVEPDPTNLRSPSLDLDSLYGAGPGDGKSRRLYEDADPARLKLDWTLPLDSGDMYRSDLPRDKNAKFQALIGDSRNDENLAIAQTHVAFIKFHNTVVDKLRAEGHGASDLFDCAQIQVIRHFQWLVLYDYLPRLVDEDIIDCVVRHGCRWFRVGRPEDLYMPLEFSAAAFRIGHTMVRGEYRWNKFHAQGELGLGSASLGALFEQTTSNGVIGTFTEGLPGDWVIDWRRFYEFPKGGIDRSRMNMAKRLDTRFDIHLAKVERPAHGGLPPEKQLLTVRNLLRGFALGLPTGEEVAACMGEVPLSPAQVAAGPHAPVLSTPTFEAKTPLWYYILKEAELGGGSKLGRVGGRIVAETLVGLIKHSRYSILGTPGWVPAYTDRVSPETGAPIFEMVDLLTLLGEESINPYDGP